MKKIVITKESVHIMSVDWLSVSTTLSIPLLSPYNPTPPKNDRGQFRNQNESIHKLIFNLFLKNET